MMPVIALIGPGELEKKAELLKILKGIDKKNIYTYFPGETEAAVIFSECGQDSLFSPTKTIVVKNFDTAKDKQKKAFEEGLDSYLDNINGNTILIITAEDLPAGIVKKIRDSGEVKQFKKMYKNDLSNYVRKNLAHEGIKFEEELPDFIAAYANEDEWETENMLQSIIYFAAVAGTGAVSIAGARSILARSSNMDIFDLVDGIFEKNPLKAAHALSDLRKEGEPVTRMVYMIMRSAKMLWAYLSGISSNLKVYELNKMKGYAKKCDLKFVSRIFVMAGKLEITAKSMKDDFSFIELESFIYTI